MKEAQILAVCLARIDKEMAAHRALVEERLRSPISESALGDLRTGLIEEVKETTIQELPPGIVFESHLQDSVRQLQQLVEEFGYKSGEAVAVSTQTLLDRIQGASQHLSEQISLKSSNDHIHDGYETMLGELGSSLKSHIEQTETAHKNFALGIETAKTDLQKAVSVESSERETIAGKIREDLATLDRQVASLVERAVEILSGRFEESRDSIQTEIQRIRKYFENLIQANKDEADALFKRILEVHSHIYKSLTGKSDVGHTHDELAKKNHQHPEYVTQKEAEDLSRSLSLLSESDQQIRQEITKLVYELSSKLSSTEAFTKKDLDYLIEQAHNSVMARIQLPKDGKDALEWEFRLHPKSNSIFQFKRSDWASWKNVSLPKSSGGGSFIGGGGGGGSPASEGILEIVPGTNINIDTTDPQRPIISSVGGGSGGSTDMALVSEAITVAYKVVTINEFGKSVHASSSQLSHINRVVGVSMNSATAGNSVEVRPSGMLVNTGWSFTSQQLLYLGIDGEITGNPNTGVFSNSIGYAINPTTIFINIGRSIVRG